MNAILPREGPLLMILLLLGTGTVVYCPEIGDGVGGCLLWGRC